MRIHYLAGSMLALTACSSGESLGQSEKAIAVFHQQLDQGAFAAIYANTTPEFRRITTEPDFIKILAAVHRKLGTFERGANNGWRLSYNTSGNNMVVQYKSHFTNGDAAETFTFNIDNSPKLIGYNINSPTLITG